MRLPHAADDHPGQPQHRRSAAFGYQGPKYSFPEQRIRNKLTPNRDDFTVQKELPFEVYGEVPWREQAQQPWEHGRGDGAPYRGKDPQELPRGSPDPGADGCRILR